MTAKALSIAALLAALAGLAAGILVTQQVRREKELGLADLEARARTLSHRISPAATRSLEDPDASALPPDRLEGFRRLIGFAVFAADAAPHAGGTGVRDFESALVPVVRESLQRRSEVGRLLTWEDQTLHLLVEPILRADGTVSGAVAVVHDAGYLDDRFTEGLVRGGFWVLLASLLTFSLMILLTWVFYERPLRQLADWMRRLREENVPEAAPPGLPSPALVSESDRLAASFRAARSSSRAASRELVRGDKIWTRDRLRAYAVESLRDSPLIVMSNREPYVHQMHEGRPRVSVPASGLVTALDPVLQACGGLWIAHGSGDADRQTCDAQGCLTVPPDDPHYTLRRVWLTSALEQGYYYGFSNEGLWPLCHLAHERPTFRASDWRQYVEANGIFANAALEETRSGKACLLVQDYHLALVPGIVRAARPDVRIGIFWHIPWPNPEAFRICPWREEILRGMLGSDVIGFHLQQHCNNFLATCDRMIECRVDWDHFTVNVAGHTARVRPFPISVQGWNERDVPAGPELDAQIERLKELHGLGGQVVAVGVDRIDYTKGIPERLRAVAAFLEKYPEYRGRFSFVQLGAPSRTHIRRYRELQTEVETLADEINWRFQTDQWKPIRMLVAHHDAPAVHAFLKMADLCIVSSLHDGMNLVAKEFVAARDDESGVLILSTFAGAARELGESLVINPYDAEEFAEAIRQAVEMAPEERRRRMQRMRTAVEEHNVYRWAAEVLADLGSGVPAAPPEAAATAGR